MLMIIIGLLVVDTILTPYIPKPKEMKASIPEIIQICLLIAALVLCILSFILYDILGYKDVVLDKECIPIHSEGLRVMQGVNNSDMYFTDGCGNTYYLPYANADIETFPDDKLKLISVSKVTKVKKLQNPVMFLLDFGLISSKGVEEKTEYYEFCIPESKMDYTTYAFPISEATCIPAEEGL